MKVVITKKCTQGNVGDVVEVKSGFANNFLFKQGLAVKDSARAREEQRNFAAKDNQDQHSKTETLDYALAKIKDDSVLNIHAKANAKGHLYAAMSEAELVKALVNQLGIVKDNLQIRLLTVIKELGKVQAEISINNVKKKLIINIKQPNDS